MTEETKESFFKGVDFHSKTNNAEHHTSEISQEQLIVRRGQPFKLTINLTHPFNPALYPLVIAALTGSHPAEEWGTMSYLSVPDGVERSPSAKAVWKVEHKQGPTLLTGAVDLIITPPADAPIGQYILCGKYREEDTLLAMLVVLFNPWCPDDWVFMSDEKEIEEYVMNEQGIIYKGSGNYIFPMHWDFGQFEDSMVQICLKLLDLNHKHNDDPADDVSARCNPIYVGRVVSAMINSEDDHGVLQGQWGGPYIGGAKPSHWNGSHAILKQWLKYDCHPVKYGQCWVFAGVMCSVMRLLGIPCRVVTNYESAHDVNKSLTIDVYHADYGVKERPSYDSVWNFHVWTEGWMRRPDLDEGGKYDGWQVLDPTPQELSDGVYCCGPAPVQAILEGQTDLKYDIPFVFAEVNADCIDWLVKEDGSMVQIWSDPQRVGQNISTKSVGSKKRLNITRTYKHKEGTDKERAVFKYACTRDYSKGEENAENANTEEDAENANTEENAENANTEENAENANTEESAEGANTEENAEGANTEENAEGANTEESDEGVNTEESDEGANTEESAEGANTEESAVNANTQENGVNENTEEAVDNAETEGNNVIGEINTADVTPHITPPPPPVTMEFKEVSQLVNGKDVSLMLVLHSKSSVARQLSINISVQAMNYNGLPAANIQSAVKEETLQPGKDLSIPILVRFSAYHKSMLDCDSMKVSAIVTDIQNPQNTYLAEDDVVLLDPPISVTVFGESRLYCESSGEVVFYNPANEMLTNCSLTLSGSGLFKEDREYALPDMRPSTRIIVKFSFVPYKTGVKTLVVDFDCSTFRDIKGSCTVKVE
ncbi:protein-glutamine gamma-glutamyltransferase 2-like [Symphorus nematophorus]